MIAERTNIAMQIFRRETIPAEICLTGIPRFGDAAARDWPGVTQSSASKCSRAVSQAIQNWSHHSLCGCHAIDCALLCARPGRPGDDRRIFTRYGLAASTRACHASAQRKGVMVAVVRSRRQPDSLGPVDQHEHISASRGSKHFLFRTRLPTNWATVGDGWTRDQLGRTPERVYL